MIVTRIVPARHDRSGFTLVELLVVLTISGLLAAVAVLRLSGLTGGARLNWALERIQAADSTVRNHAATHAQVGTLQWKLGTGTLIRSFDDSEAGTGEIDLGTGVTLTRFVSATRDTSGGTIRVDYTPQGTSETYAVEIKNRSGKEVWLFFAGRTGQVTQLEDERDVRKLLQAIQAERSHAG